ncbi:MAG: lytic transglycosylase domain-containing protein [Candidatus Eremiobacteraeota bacterium]|nr:lytic transglycosylase domain-containing protein [Candidatus Eremiobacteraeota bacterium]
MQTTAEIGGPARQLAQMGVAFAGDIAQAAQRHGIEPRLLAAVAAQETGGPASNCGRNIVGDGGHGRGVFQIDDRWHSFARTSAAMDPAQNADYAARMISGLLKQFGGNVHKALSAYNAGCGEARGTVTTWADGRRLGYADSVLRHYEQLGGGSILSRASRTAVAPSPDALTVVHELIAERTAECGAVNQLAGFALQAAPTEATHPYREIAGLDQQGRGRGHTTALFPETALGVDDAAQTNPTQGA